MKKICTTILCSLLLMSPIFADQVSVSVGSMVTTQNQVQDIAQFNIMNAGIKGKYNKKHFHQLTQQRMTQILAMKYVLKNVYITASESEIQKYITKKINDTLSSTRSESLLVESLSPIMEDYIRTIVKWEKYTNTVIAPNMNIRPNTATGLWRKVRIITTHQSPSGKKSLEKILVLIKKGTAFSRIAYGFSNDISWLNNGSIGWVKKGQVPYKLEKMISNLAVGQISPIFKLGNEYAIITLEKQNSFPADNTIQKHLYLIQSNQTNILNSHKQTLDIHFNND